MKLQMEFLGLEVSIKIVDELSGAYGDFDDSQLRIRLVKGLQKDALLLTLTHELVHLKQYLYGKEMSEEEANQDALFWHSILRDSVLFESVLEHYENAGRADSGTHGYEGEGQGETEEGMAT